MPKKVRAPSYSFEDARVGDNNQHEEIMLERLTAPTAIVIANLHAGRQRVAEAKARDLPTRTFSSNRTTWA
jgi:hypothetical protein